MLAYLFAAFSFKTDVSEGLTQEQLRAVKRWNATLAQGGGDQEATRKREIASARILTPIDSQFSKMASTKSPLPRCVLRGLLR
jgi:hypothetical protein